MAGRRTRILLVALGVLAVTVACVPTCSWDWLPFGLGGGCRRGLDEDTLNRLSLVMGDTLAMQPGETWEFSPGVVECCYVFEPVDACATWSVSPTDGATIDAETGVFTVDPGTPSGKVFTVTADVENGRRLVSADVHVYTPEANPLFGVWGEEAQFSCETDEEVVPEERIGELSFGANGEFSVTWHPFEIYKDYWGTYTFGLNQGTLDLTGAEGNYVPENLDGSGSWFIDEEGRLVLKEMWLGSPHGSSGLANCGHRFTR
ncbi:MAG TPA: hypothetical protein VJ714_07980 [Anaerolineae bacterium]|nr:hypothetical protein [Anaerolineae bacterium]